MITYYNTSKADNVRATESFQDTLIRQAYEQGQKKNKVSDKHKNKPVSQAFFNRMFADKMPRLATCMTGVETIGQARKKILVIASPEMIGFMYELGYDRSRIDFLAIQDWQVDLAIQQGIDRSRITMLKSTKGQSVKKDIEEHIKKTVTLNKYDAVIMNPPWEFTNEFRTLARALTKPDGVIGCIADAKSAQELDWSVISEFEYTAHSFAGVQLNSVVSIEQKRPVSETLLKDLQGNSISIDPEQIATPPKVDLEQWKPANEVVKQIKSGKLTGYEFANTGTLKGREVIESVDGIEMVGYKQGKKYKTATGKMNEPVPTIKVDRSLEDKIGNIDDHMVVFGADNDTGKLGPIKYKKPGIGLGSRAHGIKVKNEKEAKRVIAHLESDAVKRLVSVIKYTAKNSKGVFAQIPTHNEATDWMKSFV
jgi:hypothetical protein